MKKTIIWLSVITILLSFSSCVTKQKYQELESQYKNCSENLAQTTGEKIDFENYSKRTKTRSRTIKTKKSTS
jgi:molecular chaperone GrpE (heat shock protein)